MTGRDEERAPAPAGGERRGGGTEEPGEQAERGAPGAGAEERSGVPAPTPEEAPELLGEQSDYPIAWDGEES